MKKKCSQEHLTSPKGGVREPKPLKKVPPEEEERILVDYAKVSKGKCSRQLGGREVFHTVNKIIDVMRYIHYPSYIATVLLCSLLLQSCQSKLNALKEEATLKVPSKSFVQQQVPSDALIIPTASTRSASQHATSHVNFGTPTPSQGEQVAHVASVVRSVGATPASVPNVTSSGATQTPDVLAKVPSRSFTTSTGERLKFSHVKGEWQAVVQSDPSAYTSQRTFPVVSPNDIGAQLSWLHTQDTSTSKARIHILNKAQSPYNPCVYLGKVGLLGGMPSDDEEDSKPSAEPKTLQDLVQLYNKSEADSTARKNCQEEIEECITWFQNKKVGDLKNFRGKMLEYTALAHIEVKDPANRALLNSYCGALFSKLDDVVDQYKQGEEVLLEVLEYSLSVIDKTVFDTMSLLCLVNKLVQKTEAPENQLLAKDKAYYDANRSILCALNQAFVLMHEVSGECLDINGEAYKKLNGVIKNLKKKDTYYPLRCHALLIEQNLGHLAAQGTPVTRTDVGHFLLGSLYLGQAAVKALNLTPDLSALEKGYEHFSEVFSTNQYVKTKKWYELHQGMYCAALMSLKDSKHFNGLFKKLMQDTLTGKRIKNSALHFGIGKQLRLLALNGPTPEVRGGSITLLKDLATGQKFTVNPEVRRWVLEDLAAIAYQSAPIEDERGTEKEQALAGLEGSKGFLNSQQKAELEAIISAAKEASAVILASGGLFEEHQKSKKAKKALKDHYKNSTYFTQAPSLFEEKVQGIEELELATLQLHAQLGDEVAANASDHQSKREPKKMLIALEDLFKKISKKPGEAACEINKVLIIGNPGTGKTTLSKQLAYRWAQGEWGKEFKTVYVLPVRRLSGSDYDNGGYCREATLATAIVNNCFKPLTEESAYMALRSHVDKELKKPTTLVILDGMDERAGASEEILEQAEHGGAPHKLLMLSRSYNINTERHIADIEVELRGLSSEQQRRYVNKQLMNPEQSDSLLDLLVKHPRIGEIAHVPVNLEILCFLWRSEISRERVLKAVGKGSLPGLYREWTEYVWDRCKDGLKEYEEKATKAGLSTSDKEPLFDTLGKIALEALKEGKEIIDASLVEGPVSRFRTLEVVQDSGFLLLKWLEGSNKYEFPNLTFQEYFAGRWLAKRLFSDDEKEKKGAESFFEKNKYEPRYGRMFSFLAGTVSQREGQEGIRKLLTLTNKGAQDIVGVHHLRLQIRLLNEWLCVEQADMDAELSQLEQEFQVRDTVRERFNRGIRLARGSGDNRLLLMLTTALQEFTAVARYACPDFLDTLLAACKDKNEDVRWAAMWPLGEVIKAAPTRVKDFLVPLLEARKDENFFVRWTASKALGEVINAAPTLAKDCLAPLLIACKDENEDVRWAAMWALGEVIKADTTLAPKCLAPLLVARKDKNEYVRRAAIEDLGEVIKADTTLAPVCLALLLVACKDENPSVRGAARKALGEVINAVPTLAPVCLAPLLVACKDENFSVRRAAMEALGEVIKADTTRSQKCLDTLLIACRDEKFSVRRAAMEAMGALGEVIKAAPTLAPDCLDTLLAACKDKNEDRDVRMVAMGAMGVLGEVIKADTTRAPDCLDALLAACKDKNRDVRWAAVWAMGALGEVIKADTTRAPDCLDTLLAACKDKNEDRDVRRAAMTAMGALGEVIKAAPTLAKDCLAPLLYACKDKDEDIDVRWAAMKALGELINADLTLAKDFLAPLLAACKDKNEDRDVRRAAIGALVEVIKADTTLAPKCLSPLLFAFKDENVCMVAMWALGEVIKADTMRAPECLDTLLAACKDKNEDRDVRRAAMWAMGALGEVIKADTMRAPDCLDTLLAACKDKNEDRDIRWAAMRAMGALGEVIKADPTRAPDFLAPLLAACKDKNEDRDVRMAAMAAMWALGEVIKATPTLAPKCLGTLLAACKDKNEDRDVRMAAMRAMRAMGTMGEVIKAVPTLAPKCLDTLLDACKDENEDEHLRWDARKALEELSLEQLIECYWATKNKELIPIIAPRCYQTPLVVTDNYQKIVLYDTAGKPVSWNKPQKEVEELINLMKSQEDPSR
jgi:HEAT repeat protein